MTSRAVTVAMVLVLTATGAGYVRRSYLPPPTAAVEPDRDASRDRRLSGKARVRARRSQAVLSP